MKKNYVIIKLRNKGYAFPEKQKEVYLKKIILAVLLLSLSGPIHVRAEETDLDVKNIEDVVETFNITDEEAREMLTDSEYEKFLEIKGEIEGLKITSGDTELLGEEYIRLLQFIGLVSLSVWASKAWWQKSC